MFVCVSLSCLHIQPPGAFSFSQELIQVLSVRVFVLPVCILLLWVAANHPLASAGFPYAVPCRLSLPAPGEGTGFPLLPNPSRTLASRSDPWLKWEGWWGQRCL